MRKTFDFEGILQHYPKQFNVAKCLSNERTCPTNKTKSIAAEQANLMRSTRAGVTPENQFAEKSRESIRKSARKIRLNQNTR